MNEPVGSDVYVHPHGLCESNNVGSGTRVWAFAHVMAGAHIGNNCNVCDHAFVEGGVAIGDRVTIKNRVMLFEGVTIEDDAFLGPGVIFTNDPHPRAYIKRRGCELARTRVQQGATLGAGAVVVCGTTIGRYAFIGAGTVVTKDVPPYAFVIGNPGRIIGRACECGRRLPKNLTCSCGISYYKATSGPAHRNGGQVV